LLTSIIFANYFPETEYEIIAFEPNKALVDHAPQIKNLRLFNYALSNEQKEIDLHIPCFPGESTDIVKGIISEHRAPDGGIYGTSTLSERRKDFLISEIPVVNMVSINISAVRLDDFMMKLGIQKIHWVKLDVEQYEKVVFEGASNLLKNNSILAGQFEGETELRSNGYDGGDGLGNDATTQEILNRGNLIALDSLGMPVTLPSSSSFIPGEFFFINASLL